MGAKYSLAVGMIGILGIVGLLDGVRASAGTHTTLNQIPRKIPIAVVDNDLSA